MSKSTKPKQTAKGFVLSLPPSLNAKEVVEKAKGAGVKVSEAYVYVIRSQAAKGPKAAKRSAKRATKRSDYVATSEDGALRKAIARIGIDRARAILAEVETAFMG